MNEELGLSLDAAARMDAKALADEGFELLFSGDFAGLRAAFCDFDAGRFRAAPEYISLLLLRAFAEGGGKPLQSELERCMDARQLALQRLLQLHLIDNLSNNVAQPSRLLHLHCCAPPSFVA